MANGSDAKGTFAQWTRQLADRAKASEEMYRYLLENANDAIIVLALDGRIIEMNRRSEELFGRPRSERIGGHILDHVQASDQGRSRELLARLGAEGSVRAEGIRVVRGDGSVAIADFSAARVETDRGPVVVAIGRDVTESRQREDALRRSEERFRNLVHSIDDFVFTYDLEQRIDGVFGRWLEIHRRSPADFVGRHARDYLAPQDVPQHEAAATRALAGESVTYEWTRPDGGETQYWQTSLSPMRDAEGRVFGLVGIARDVTEAKRTQAQLMAADRQASIGTLATGVAHQINNPLATIMVNLDLALEQIDQASVLGEELRDAREAAERMRVIVRDLALSSRVPPPPSPGGS